ncbi:MAG: hypothetical protein LUC34_07050 [Campylobacter sp.]|nr:hypothetical protein [Campylobacter sp.]
MSVLDISQIVFITVVVVIGLGLIVKVAFLDDKDK